MKYRINLSFVCLIFFFIITSSCKKEDDKSTEFVMSTGEVLELNGNYALASGKLRLTSGTVTSYGHVWSVYQGPTIDSDNKTDLGSSSSTIEFVSELQGLSPGTFYYTRAYAKGSEVQYGNEIPFRTPNMQVSSIELLSVSTQYIEIAAHITVHSGAIATYGFWSFEK